MGIFLAKDAQLKWVSDQCSDRSAPVGLVLQRIMTRLHADNPNYYWVGVYFLKDNELVLGPYAGPTTEHLRIPVGRGVCGTAVAENKDQVVDDVSSLDNYLACNLETKSEMVALIRRKDQSVIGQLDIDATKLALFDRAEQKFIRQIADHLGELLAST